MNKKRWKVSIISITLVVLVSSILILIIKKERNKSILDDLEVTGLEKIEIWQNNTGVSITEMSDMEKTLNLLQSMHLKRISPKILSGYRFAIHLYPKDGDRISLTIASNRIVIMKNVYWSDKNYSDKYEHLYDEFMKMYGVIE